MKKKFATVDEYFESLPEKTAVILGKMRTAIKQAAPGATEKISYNMPAFELNGNLVYYAGFRNHVSLFPHAEPIVAFKNELKDFYTSKGTIQFPLDKTLPVTIIKKIVRYRVLEKTKAPNRKITSGKPKRSSKK